MPTFQTGSGRSTLNAYFLLKMPRSQWFKEAVIGALSLLMYDGNWVENGDQTTHDAHDIAGEMLQGAIMLDINPLPVGKVEAYAGSTVPEGWLQCDGASLATADYPELFDAIAYTWGGAGANFNLPNLQDLVIVGAGNAYSLADAGGEVQHTLTLAEIASHTHTATVTDIGHTHSDLPALPNVTTIGAGAPQPTAIPGVGVTGLALTGISVSNSIEGSDSPHNNLQPYAALNWIIYAGR